MFRIKVKGIDRTIIECELFLDMTLPVSASFCTEGVFQIMRGGRLVSLTIPSAKKDSCKLVSVCFGLAPERKRVITECFAPMCQWVPSSRRVCLTLCVGWKSCFFKVPSVKKERSRQATQHPQFAHTRFVHFRSVSNSLRKQTGTPQQCFELKFRGLIEQ